MNEWMIAYLINEWTNEPTNEQTNDWMNIDSLLSIYIKWNHSETES